MGQTLFEVAPLDDMVVEISVPQREITHLQEGQKVRVRLDAFPGRTWHVQLTNIQPRSEVRDQQNVFIGDGTLENADQQFRPGMNGRAKIVTSRRSLGWILFHKPWEAFVMWLGC